MKRRDRSKINYPSLVVKKISTNVTAVTFRNCYNRDKSIKVANNLTKRKEMKEV